MKNDYGSLFHFFEERFDRVEKEMRSHSQMMLGLGNSLQKVMDMQFRLAAQMESLLKPGSAYESKKVEERAEISTNFLKANIAAIPEKKSRNKENDSLRPAATMPVHKTQHHSPEKERKEYELSMRAKKSERTELKVSELQPKKTSWKRNDISIEPPVESNPINAIFSPNHAKGEPRMMIIEPIDVEVQESTHVESTTKTTEALRENSSSKALMASACALSGEKPHSGNLPPKSGFKESFVKEEGTLKFPADTFVFRRPMQAKEDCEDPSSCFKYSYRSKTPKNDCTGRIPKALGITEGQSTTRERKTITQYYKHEAACFEGLPGKCLLQIAEFMGSYAPLFLSSNRSLLRNYTKYVYEHSLGKITYLNKQYCTLIHQKSFKLSSHLKEKYDRFPLEEWHNLLEPSLKLKISNKDLLIFQLYFAFMGKDYHANAKAASFSLCRKFVESYKWRLPQAMDPEIHFAFTSDNLERVRCVLTRLKVERVDLKESSSCYVFELMAGIINEALQHAKLVPSAHRADEVHGNILFYERLKKLMQRLMKFVHPL